jgi:hypothetical protein
VFAGGTFTVRSARYRHSRYSEVWQAVATCYSRTSREFLTAPVQQGVVTISSYYERPASSVTCACTQGLDVWTGASPKTTAATTGAAWGSPPASGGYGLALCVQTILEALGVALVLCRGSGALD